MSAIVRVTITDQTRAIDQAGFKSLLIVDFNQDYAIAKVTDTTGLTGDLLQLASRYFANGGYEVFVAGKTFTSGVSEADITSYLDTLKDGNDFYGITASLADTEEAVSLDALQTFAISNEKLVVTEVNGADVSAVQTLTTGRNSDRIAVYAGKSATNYTDYEGSASAVSGIGFPKTEGSLTWGNQVVTDVPVSGWTLAEEATLIADNVNYITNVLGLVVSQFGKTLSGSNIDITRSKDWLKNRVIESVSSLLINEDKVPFTNGGLSQIAGAIAPVGEQGITQGMIDSYYIEVPKISEIPANDKANRILRNVKLTVVLAGAIETVEINITVTL